MGQDMRESAQNEGVSPPDRPRAVGFAPIDAARAPKIPAPAQPAEYYKSRSLAARNWGALAGSGEGLRQVSAQEAQETFLKNLLDTPTTRGKRSPVHWMLSVGLQAVVVAAVVIIPLTFTQVLDTRDLRATYLELPPPPPPAPPPSAPNTPARPAVRRITTPTITMPTIVPKRIAEVRSEPAPEIGGTGVPGATGGLEGGVLGGVIGGVGGGPPPPPPPASAPPKRTGPYRVGGEVKAPRQIARVDPVYSPVARVAKVEGVVLIDAVIDEHGDVVQAKAISGPPLLMPAALQAVLKWKYEPTYLDGMPVPIEMRVEVGFHLH